MEKERVYTPIPCKLPSPKNCEIRVQCFMCQNFPVCSIREDYLKVAQLIQKILGDPADDYLLTGQPFVIPDFSDWGYKLENGNTFFDVKLITDDDKDAVFYEARFKDKDNFKIAYKIDGYIVIFSVIYDNEKGFIVSTGKEPFYHLEFTLSSESFELFILECEELREYIIENPYDPDIINTTAFSAKLNCDFYNPIRGLRYEDGIRKIAFQYPDGIPLREEGELYHLATFHIEKDKVPCYHPENGRVAFIPMPYAIPTPPPKCMVNKITRGDQK